SLAVTNVSFGQLYLLNDSHDQITRTSDHLRFNLDGDANPQGFAEFQLQAFDFRFDGSTPDMLAPLDDTLSGALAQIEHVDLVRFPAVGNWDESTANGLSTGRSVTFFLTSISRVAPVPLPVPLPLLGSGLLGLWGWRRAFFVATGTREVRA